MPKLCIDGCKKIVILYYASNKKGIFLVTKCSQNNKLTFLNLFLLYHNSKSTVLESV